MGQPLTCDNADGTPAFIIMTQPESGDTDALCAPCLLEWAYGLLSQSELGAQLLMAKMGEMLPDAVSAARRPAAKAGKTAARKERVEDTGGDAPPAADTPGAD